MGVDVFQMFKGKQSGLLYQTLVILRSILNQNRVKGRIDGKYLLELLDVDFRRIAETIKKFRVSFLCLWLLTKINKFNPLKTK